MAAHTIFLASDHGGLDLKNELVRHTAERGLTAVDLGTHSEGSVDYPDFAAILAEKLKENREAIGVLVCGTGIGISMKANRYPHIRAALVVTDFMAKMAKEHNDANVIVFGGRVIDKQTACRLFDIFFDAEFEGGRHQRRVDKLS